MKKVNRILQCCVLFLFFTLFNINVLANSDGMFFSVDVIPPINQIDENITYFDIQVEPNKEQKLELDITNNDSKKHKIAVTPTNAITNGNGIVDYSIQEKEYVYDKTLKTPFTTLVSTEQVVELEPGETKTVSFDFISPKKEFEGIILGGFVTHLISDETDEVANSGVSFINEFQFVKAVIIRSSDTELVPKITLNDVRPALHNYRTAVTANLQNTTPLLLGDVNVDAKVFKEGETTPIKSEKKNNVEFAPNSNFDFPIMWDNERLEPGKYNLEMTVSAKEEVFTFSELFTITKAESNSINKEATELEKKELSLAFWLVFTFILILVVSILGFIIFKQYEKNKRMNANIKSKRNKSIQKFIKENKKKED